MTELSGCVSVKRSHSTQFMRPDEAKPNRLQQPTHVLWTMHALLSVNKWFIMLHQTLAKGC